MTCISYQEGMVVELRESTSDGIDVLQTSRYLQPCVSQPKQVFLTKNGFWLLGWVITLGLWFRMINFFLLSLDVCLLQVRIFSLCVANCWSTFATIIYNLNNKRSCLYLQTTPSKCEWPIPGYAWNCLTCQDLKRWSCDPVQTWDMLKRCSVCSPNQHWPEWVSWSCNIVLIRLPLLVAQ